MICTTAIIVSVVNVVPAGEFQKTILWMVFLTEFHPNGFESWMSHEKEKAPLLERSFKMVDRRGLEPRTLGLRERLASYRNVSLYIKFRLLCFVLL